MYPAPMPRADRLAALSAHGARRLLTNMDVVVANHRVKVVLKRRNVPVLARMTRYKPLCLRRAFIQAVN